MKAASVSRAAALSLSLAGLAFATPAAAESCRNSCVTMAIPAAPGVQTKLDGSADAALWPPSHELRRIEISALNSEGANCDVTIRDVRQDEAPGMSGAGSPIDDAVNCHNEGETSSVDLRSDRADNGNGRSYQVSFTLKDPACDASEKSDEVLVAVPRSEDAITSIKPDEDVGNSDELTASYAGPSLECTPAREHDRLAAR